MRQLIPREREPITPLVERVRQLHQVWGVSTILVVGGVADYLSAADTVIAMEAWLPRLATDQARALLPEAPVPPDALKPLRYRVPQRQGLAPGRKTGARDKRALRYGGEEVDLQAVEQVLDGPHAATMGEALRLLHEEIVDGHRDLSVVLDALDAILDDEGVEALAPRAYPPGDLVRARRHEVAAALSRLRSLRVARPSSP